MDAAGIGAHPSVRACVHAYIYTQREACRLKNAPGAVRRNAHGVFLQHQSPGSNLLLQGKCLDMCMCKPKGAPTLPRELGAHQYACEEGLLSRLQRVASSR